MRGMPPATRYDATSAQLLITLCGFSYMDSSPLPGETIAQQEARMRTDIDAALVESGYADWHVVWGPGLSDDRGNMMYVAGQSTTQRLAVAIRGTEWEFWLNWIEDFASVLPLVPYTDVLPGVPAGSPLIAVGTNIGLQLLLGIEAETVDGQTMDLASFLQQAGGEARIFVTGHSLGGCLASVLAPSVAYRLGSADNLIVYTFAAPSAGDSDFAEYYNTLFAGRSFRVYNDLDIVPASWATLPSIAELYSPAPECSERIKQLIARVERAVQGEYVQPGRARKLKGKIAKPLAVALTPDRATLMFFYEVGQQHATATYQELLNAPVITPALGKLLAASSRLR